MTYQSSATTLCLAIIYLQSLGLNVSISAEHDVVYIGYEPRCNNCSTPILEELNKVLTQPPYELFYNEHFSCWEIFV